MNRENFGMKIRVLENLPAMQDRRLNMAVHIALATALRRSEILHLRVEELLNGGGQVAKTIKVKRKGGKTQMIYLPDGLRQELQAYVGERKIGWLLESTLHRHQRLPPETLCVLWHRAQTEAGIPNEDQFRFHDLRHTAITRFLRETGNLRLTQIFAGHSNISTTAIYTHPTEEEMFEAMQKIEDQEKGGI